jgi:hypothetical protein
MTGKKKKVDFSVRPRADTEPLPPTPEEWVREGKGESAGPHKRLTLNLPAGLHVAFKSRCVVEGVTIQDRVRELIEHYLASSRPAPGEGGQSL